MLPMLRCHSPLIWRILIGWSVLGKSWECLVTPAGFKAEGRYQAVNNVADGMDSIVFGGRKTRAVIKESQSRSSCKGSFPRANTMRLRRAWLMSRGGTHCAAMNGPPTTLPSPPLRPPRLPWYIAGVLPHCLTSLTSFPARGRAQLWCWKYHLAKRYWNNKHCLLVAFSCLSGVREDDHTV